MRLFGILGVFLISATGCAGSKPAPSIAREPETQSATTKLAVPPANTALASQVALPRETAPTSAADKNATKDAPSQTPKETVKDTQSEAPKDGPPKREPPEPASDGSCPAGMKLVDGDYCTDVDYECKKSWYDKSNKK